MLPEYILRTPPAYPQGVFLMHGHCILRQCYKITLQKASLRYAFCASICRSRGFPEKVNSRRLAYGVPVGFSSNHDFFPRQLAEKSVNILYYYLLPRVEGARAVARLEPLGGTAQERAGLPAPHDVPVA